MRCGGSHLEAQGAECGKAEEGAESGTFGAGRGKELP